MSDPAKTTPEEKPEAAIVSHDPHQDGVGYDWSYAFKGMRRLFSIPAMVLLSMFIGYGSVAHDAGLSLAQTAYSVLSIWALPGNLILVAGISSGASLFAIALAVGLASLRMMPMTIAWLPEVRAPNTKRWHLYLASSLVAVTVWVHTLDVARTLPTQGRLPYFVGFGTTLLIGATIVSMITWQASAQMPPTALAALYFLTPLYFAISIWRTARIWAEHLALILGFALGPILAVAFPGGNILLAGLIGGISAYGAHRIWRKRIAP